MTMTNTRAVYSIFNAHSGADMWLGLAIDELDALRQLDELVTAHEPSHYGTGPDDSGLAWVEVKPATDLDTLVTALRVAGDGIGAETCAALGLPYRMGSVDTSELPTFGGDAPADTSGIWSWDATRLLVEDMQIVKRDDYEA
jgi:hypothetical protein